MKRRQSAKLRRNMIILLVLIVIGMLCGWGFNQAKAQEKQAKQEAIQMAQKYANITSVKQFYWYNRDQSYYTIVGTNKNNQSVYVIIPQKGNKVVIYGTNTGIDAKKARSITTSKFSVKTITHVALGLYHNQPVWEVTYFNQKNKLCYVLLSFKQGKVINQINNL